MCPRRIRATPSVCCGRSRAFTTIAALSLALGDWRQHGALQPGRQSAVFHRSPFAPPSVWSRCTVVDFYGGRSRKPLNTFSPFRVFDDIRAHAPLRPLRDRRFSVVWIAPRSRLTALRIRPERSSRCRRTSSATSVWCRLSAARRNRPMGRWPSSATACGRTRFGGSPSVVGRALIVDGRVCSIVGVAPPRFPVDCRFKPRPILWMTSRTGCMKQMIARLKPGVTAEQAQSALQPARGPIPRRISRRRCAATCPFFTAGGARCPPGGESPSSAPSTSGLYLP